MTRRGFSNWISTPLKKNYTSLLWAMRTENWELSEGRVVSRLPQSCLDNWNYHCLNYEVPLSLFYLMLMTLMVAAAALKLLAISVVPKKATQNRKCFAAGRAQGSQMVLMRARPPSDWIQSSIVLFTDVLQSSLQLIIFKGTDIQEFK